MATSDKSGKGKKSGKSAPPAKATKPRAAAKSAKTAKSTRPILGDDPFEPPTERAAKAPSAPAEPPVDAIESTEPIETIEESLPELLSIETITMERVSEESITLDGKKEPAAITEPPRHQVVEAAPPSEYGPSIDRDQGTSALRRRVVDAVRQLEQEARTRLGRPVGTEDRPHAPPFSLLWKPLRELAMRKRSASVDEFGRDPKVWEEVEPALDFFYKTWFRVQARGMEHVPATGRALIVGNHSGTLPYDGAMIMHGVHREHPAHRAVRPLVEDFVFHFPYLGTLMNRIGGVRACQENAERLLRDDQLVAVFPEGIKGIGKLFSQRYQLQRFGRGGFIKLALATDSPIIPVAVIGAEEIHPMLARITWLSKALGIPYLPLTPTFPWLGPIGLVPLPTRWYIAFGAPLYFNAEYGEGAAHDRILVNKLAEQVRQKIQEMIDALLIERQSVLFG